MKNTLLNFNEVQVDGPNSELFYLNDFTNLYFSIPEKYTKNEMYYTNYLVADNETIENIAYKEYGTVRRWDILLITNKIDSPLSLPKDYNTVLEKADILYNRWEKLHGFGKPDWFKLLKQKYFTQLANIENEKFRTIKIIKDKYLLELMYILDDQIKAMKG